MKICLVCQTQYADGWTCPACAWQPASVDGLLRLLSPENQIPISGYKGEFFAPLAALESGHFWFAARNRLITWALKHYFPQAQNFLEIGCGTGFVLLGIRGAFPDLTLAGAEYFLEGLTFAQQRIPNAEFYQLDARELPFKAHYDVIGAFDVLEHIQEDEQVLEQMYQATSPNGGILLTVPQHRFLWSVADEYRHHVRRYERNELISKVEAAGFKVRYVSSFVSALMPAVLFSRWAQNRKRQQTQEIPDRLTELDINPTANAIFNQVMQVETRLIQLGLKLPMGSSLLLAADKA